MSCNSPFFAIPLVDCETTAHVVNPDTGKQQYRIVSMRQLNKVLIDKYLADSDVKQVPCGHCMACRLAYSRTWANRLMLEKKYYPDYLCWFITLTYNDWHVPFSDQQTMTLFKRDVQLFFKRLRSNTGQKIRYFLSGEYGTSTMRPHYHAIVFGLDPGPLDLQYVDSRGSPFYRSALVERVWSAEYDFNKLELAVKRKDFDRVNYCTETDYYRIGNVLLSPVSWDTCAYTARYVVKKLTGKGASFYDEYGLAVPFSLSSRRPGIGRQYYDDYKDEIFRHEYFSIGDSSGSRRVYPPRYYKSLFDVDNHDAFLELVASHSQFSRDSSAVRRVLSGYDYWTQQEIAERQLTDKVNSLERRLD